ncbi:MAG: hypothetical protein OH319_01575 [Candidatus Parvarchaeota archaeon]|nr:hypothetical protein [Candidatus Jingweiarchaeum tengchongense]MCW1297739.1 hypothetical protein [Candidatus Jingweiarchaeum tengchongense]MCW1299749.1 hypothetical protein [Candidatus Jingweiarchaeum tengchongense]MCW1304280.1 hypothetical protein [Candidatus Jingweiarchaeum tengchongense]MCW1305307.1 hypothetical protein [Candidatus Jingweiarchaeum tengchongense]
MKKGIEREVMQLLLALFVLFTVILIIIFLRGKGDELIEKIQKLFSFGWLTG